MNFEQIDAGLFIWSHPFVDALKSYFHVYITGEGDEWDAWKEVVQQAQYYLGNKNFGTIYHHFVDRAETVRFLLSHSTWGLKDQGEF